MSKKFIILMIGLMVLLLGTTAIATSEQETGYPWRDHAAPYDYLFGNLIDNHQQVMQQNNGTLIGYIYIQFTGEVIDGVPVAVRADCEVTELDCRVGWVVQGIPFQATLVQKGPRKWKVDAESLPRVPGYTHFHWLGYPDKPCRLIIENGESTGQYDGYLLKRTAIQHFYWMGGSTNAHHNGRLVTPGIDLHSNIVTTWNYTDGSGSGGQGGGCDGHDDSTDSDGGCGGHDDGTDSDGGCGGHDDGTDSDGGCDGHTDDGSDSDGGCSGH